MHSMYDRKNLFKADRRPSNSSQALSSQVADSLGASASSSQPGSLLIPKVNKKRMQKAASVYTPTDIVGLGSSPTKLGKRRASDEITTFKVEKNDFLKEYSQFNMSAIQSSVINKVAEKKRPATQAQPKTRQMMKPVLKKQHSLLTMQEQLTEKAKYFEDIDKHSFDIFNFTM